MTGSQQGAASVVGHVAMTTSVGQGVQKVVRKGAGAIQQLMGQRYNRAHTEFKLTPNYYSVFMEPLYWLDMNTFWY